MTRSMTGFGRGRCAIAGRQLIVEIRAVNHRFLDLKQRLPWADPGLEQRLAQAIRDRLHRGAITVAARDEGGGDVAPSVIANPALAVAYYGALCEIAAACGIDERPQLATLAALPGVIVVGGAVGDEEALWRELAPAVAQALDDLVATREREGEALRQDLLARLARLRQLSQELAGLAAEVPAEAKRRLGERLARLLAPGEVDPQRLAQEVAILADRADVAEELTRLRTHLDEFARLLDDDKPAGRRLDFLSQELHREINTIGAKSQRSEIAGRVVDAKTEIERLREQVQNVE